MPVELPAQSRSASSGDGAHNPSGVAALVESLPEVVAGRRLVAVVSILDDKDAAGMLRELLPACQALVLTSNPKPRALPPATLESLARLTPNDVHLHLLLGSLYRQAQRQQDAVRAFRWAVRLPTPGSFESSVISRWTGGA